MKSWSGAYFNQDLGKVAEVKESIHDFHFQIVEELFGKGAIPENVRGLFAELEGKLGILPSKDYDFEYDQLICYGELLSTSIIADYLDSIQKNAQWVDIRKCLKPTNSTGKPL